MTSPSPSPSSLPAPPLQGLRVIEFEGLGPGPLAGLMLARAGASVTAVVRPDGNATAERLGGAAALRRGKQVVALDLKTARGVADAMELVAGAEALIEGQRPGVMERLGLGPEPCLARNPSLVYSRITGWGQHGPLAQAAGHDLNYVALSGLLALSARPGQAPIVPPTVIGDGAGALGLAFELVCGVLQARAGGQGRVIDSAMLDAAAQIGGLAQWLHEAGTIGGARPSPFHGSPFYEVYACADGRFVSVAALEPAFYALLLRKLGCDDVDPAAQYDSAHWPALRERFAALFRTRTRDDWCALLEGSDACFAPVLNLDEAAAHPQQRARRGDV